MQTVSVVLPTRNEQGNIAKILNRIKPYGYKVIVVDDSDDATKYIAISLGVKVIEGKRKGLGQAIIDGIKASKSDIVVVMDADGSHAPKYIKDLVEPILQGKQDMTVGSRYVKNGGSNGWTLKRKIISRCASFLGFIIVRVRDSTSGFFAFNRHILNGATLKADSWKIMLEVLVKTKPKRVLEVPIIFEDRQSGKSKFNSKQIIAYLKHLCLLAMWKYRVLNFMAVGGIGFIVNMGLYYPLTLVFEQDVTFLGKHFYLPPFLISSCIAIISNYHFNKVWTFSDRKAKSLSFMRYFGMAGLTLLIDMFVLFLMVDYAHLQPMISAMIAIAFVFVLRYFVAKSWIWGEAIRG